MERIYPLLEKYRLESYYNKFLDIGVKDERDFIDSISDEDLTNLGLTQVEKRRFSALTAEVSRLRAPVRKSLEPFTLHYTYPKCPEPKVITEMDPAQNTVEDLMLRISSFENIGSSREVCLYTVDGMPLTDDPFFNSWSLQDRHIKDGDIIYAIFTPKENLTSTNTSSKMDTDSGTSKIRCHIMLRGDFEVNVNLEKDTIFNLKNKLANESGIPARVLHYIDGAGDGMTLEDYGITEEKTVHFSLSSFDDEAPSSNAFFTTDIIPSVRQTPKGMSVFLSSLYVIKHKSPIVPHTNLIGYIRKLTGCNPLAQTLYQLLLKNEVISRIQRIAVVEGLYTLFREILPKLGSKHGDKIIEDEDVFEYSQHCWAYLMSEAKKETSHHENFAPVSLTTEQGRRFREPITVAGVPGALERADVLQKIKDGERIPNCTEVLQPTSLWRNTEVEKILLSVHPSIKTYQLWISHGIVTGQNFHINIEKTIGMMEEEMKAFPLLLVTPPLLLKDLGYQDPCLVFLSEDNLGVYLHKDKCKPDMITVYDCLAGKTSDVDVNILAQKIGDLRKDQSFVTTRTPKEAILVLIDTSQSMAEQCYGSVEIQKLHAVKELFNNFATRTMAYDFHHVIGLVQFNSTVKTIHTFTETLEKFKESVQTLEPSGTTKLYDALLCGIVELVKVRTKFPDCRLRILCLTDGNDVGSSSKPADVAAKLITHNITVDSILLGNVENNILHGISNATGGCCFKPETSKDGLKLFETETVLSLEIRKPKNKADASSITEESLRGFFPTHGYDDFPEAVLPSQISSKVTLTQNALKNKIQESKDHRFMEKDRRILEELKDLHCHPHPYFTIFPSESDFTFWKILMEGPPETSYENGVFELFCQFGPDYPQKPPNVRFVTKIYHCNINNVGRICHNIFDRAYNAHITMKEILDAIFGLLIVPEPEDPLDSILAEEYLTSRQKYDEEAKKHTAASAGQSLDEMEKKLVELGSRDIPEHLICPLSKKMFVDPVKTKHGRIYERKAIEKYLKTSNIDPFNHKIIDLKELKSDPDMKNLVTKFRSNEFLMTCL